MFSPRYRRARRRAAKQGEPAPLAEAFAGVNFVVYSPDKKERAWAMTEYDASSVARSDVDLQIGDNAIHREGDTLIIDIDERAPWTGRPIRGQIKIELAERSDAACGPYAIDGQGRHRWYPIAPHAEVEVTLESPALTFRGRAYHDSNEGDEGLEDAFENWDWSRRDAGDHAEIVYDTRTRDGGSHRLALRIQGAETQALELSDDAAELELDETRWGLQPRLRSHEQTQAELQMRLEDTPFYARSLLRVQAPDATVHHAVHEHLDMRRFERATTQFMLPWRTRRSR